MSLMNDSINEFSALETEIYEMEKRVAALIEEEVKEKNESIQLTLQKKHLQNRLANLYGKSDLEDYYLKNIEYLDQRIANHQETLEKYKQCYQSLQDRSNVSCAYMPNNQYFSQKEQFSKVSENGYSKQKKFVQKIQMEQSLLSVRSGMSKSNAKEAKKSINVICQMQCQSCGGLFKPYRYYSHVNGCQKGSLLSSKMCTSVLVD